MSQFQSPIGIIGGAGPTAGAYLFQRIIAVCQEKYLCKRDADFPYLFLESYPFSDMLGEDVDQSRVEAELNACIQNLIANKVENSSHCMQYIAWISPCSN